MLRRRPSPAPAARLPLMRDDAAAPATGRSTVRRSYRTGLAVLAGAATLGLSGCTATMDMTISAQGTYDVVLEMRDTTGTTFGANPDCSIYEDPTTMNIPQGTKVDTEVLSGQEGSGCLVKIHGVKVPDSSQAQEGALVVRKGDQYTVTIPALGTDAKHAAGNQGESFISVVKARAAVTFPGAVTQAGGGQVNASTVTWEDADVLVGGVSASGYVQEARGIPWWKRAGSWLTGALAAAGAGVGVAVVRKRRRRRRRA